MNAVALCLLTVMSLSPDTPVSAETADLIELNHCYNEDGQLVFDQLIFWEWNEDESCYNVAAYRVLRAETNALRFDWNQKEYVASWCDHGLLREIRAPHYRQTWTQYDPELEDRRRFPQEARKGLRYETLIFAGSRRSTSGLR